MRFAPNAVSFLAAILALGVAPASPAQWGGVAYVDSHGRQWRQLNASTGATWNQVASMCPVDGVTPCTGVLNNQSITGWVWASRAQVQQMLAELGANVGSCSSGSTASGNVFGYFLSTTNADLTSVVDGWSSSAWDTFRGTGLAYAPTVRFDQDSLVGFTCVDAVAQRSESNTDRGVWLFRPPCPADINRDGVVGPADLASLLGSWGTGGSADLSGNGIVGAEDLSILLASWGSGGC